MAKSYDVIVVGSGIAGLSFALQVAEAGYHVAIITKKNSAESNTNYEETDFNVLTDVYHKSEDLQKLVDPWKEDIFRTHILKINPGGYFPPHRDYRGTLFDSFRLIVSLKNQCKFLIEERPINFIDGSMYFIDTAKEHTLFNVHDQPSYWIVFNVQLNEKTVKKVTENFSVR